MPVVYRRPGVYLEESLLINPVDVAGTTTVAAFVGAALKGPPSAPILVSSWSDYVTIFVGFDLIEPPIPPNPNDQTYEVFGTTTPPADRATLKAHPTYGDGHYSGEPFTAGQYVILGNNSHAYYDPSISTNRATTAPGQQFAADPDITASDSTNAAKLAGEGFVAVPLTAWTAGQYMWVGPYGFSWSGSAWTAQPAAVRPNIAVWKSGDFP